MTRRAVLQLVKDGARRIITLFALVYATLGIGVLAGFVWMFALAIEKAVFRADRKQPADAIAALPKDSAEVQPPEQDFVKRTWNHKSWGTRVPLPEMVS